MDDFVHIHAYSESMLSVLYFVHCSVLKDVRHLDSCSVFNDAVATVTGREQKTEYRRQVIVTAWMVDN